MKISSFTLINTWNAYSYIFKSLVDDDRSATIAARRMKLSEIKIYEDDKVQKILKLKDGDTIEGPYNLLIPIKNEDKNAFLHLYLVDPGMIKYTKYGATNNYFSDQYPTYMIFMDKSYFTLDSGDIDKVVEAYFDLFRYTITFMSLEKFNENEYNELENSCLTLFITYSFLKCILPESYMDNASELLKNKFSTTIYIPEFKMNESKFIKLIDRFLEQTNKILIPSVNTAKAQEVLFDYMNYIGLIIS